MKKFDILLCCFVMPFAVLLSACSYRKQTANILNIPAENYNLIYETGGGSLEVVSSTNNMRVYYFICSPDGYVMKSGSLISEFLYRENADSAFVDSISYTFADNSITINGQMTDEKELSYEEFKTYCLAYFGDNADSQFATVIFNLLQECLTKTKINQIHGGIFRNDNLCYADIDMGTLSQSEVYLGIIKQRLSDTEYKSFENKLRELSATTQKSVTLEILTDNNYEFIYPTVTVTHQGISWFNINLFSYISSLS